MTTTINRHLDAATLMSFAAGSLGEALSAAAAAHAAICPACRHEIRAMERLGAALLGQESGDAIGMPPRPADPESVALAPAGDVRTVDPGSLPYPIAQQYGLSLENIPWKRLGPGVWHHRLALSPGAEGDLRLLKVAAGRRMPEHGHGGTELTLVLDGAFADATGHYCCGDIQDVDEDTEHRPVADATTGCICLVASERPARFTGLISRLVQPLTGM